MAPALASAIKTPHHRNPTLGLAPKFIVRSRQRMLSMSSLDRLFLRDYTGGLRVDREHPDPREECDRNRAATSVRAACSDFNSYYSLTLLGSDRADVHRVRVRLPSRPDFPEGPHIRGILLKLNLARYRIASGASFAPRD